MYAIHIELQNMYKTYTKDSHNMSFILSRQEQLLGIWVICTSYISLCISCTSYISLCISCTSYISLCISCTLYTSYYIHTTQYVHIQDRQCVHYIHAIHVWLQNMYKTYTKDSHYMSFILSHTTQYVHIQDRQCVHYIHV